jgi:membrane protein YqaA with SNARE-associated domain
MKKYIGNLQKFAEKIWYPPFLSVLSLIDVFVLFIPVDGLMISSVLLTPKRWKILGLLVGLGSILGALLLG